MSKTRANTGRTQNQVQSSRTSIPKRADAKHQRLASDYFLRELYNYLTKLEQFTCLHIAKEYMRFGLVLLYEHA